MARRYGRDLRDPATNEDPSRQDAPYDCYRMQDRGTNYKVVKAGLRVITAAR